MVRQYRSCLTKKLIEKYRKASISVDPANYNKKISDKPTSETIKIGAELMKKDGFKIATQEVVKGL